MPDAPSPVPTISSPSPTPLLMSSTLTSLTVYECVNRVGGERTCNPEATLVLLGYARYVGWNFGCAGNEHKGNEHEGDRSQISSGVRLVVFWCALTGGRPSPAEICQNIIALVPSDAGRVPTHLPTNYSPTSLAVRGSAGIVEVRAAWWRWW